MKKFKIYLGVFVLFLVAIVCVPNFVNAKESQNVLEDIHNQISTNNRLNVNSIPIDYYEESAYYSQCMIDHSYAEVEVRENMCKNSIYGLIVRSYLNHTIEKDNDVTIMTENCDIGSRTCDITVGNPEDLRTESYNIDFVGEYNDNDYRNIKDYSSKLKNRYYLSDMHYINQLLNFVNEEGSLLDMMYDNYKIFKTFPEIKHDLEKNPNYKYVPVQLGMGGSSLMYGGAGVVVMYDDGVAMDISSEVSYNTLKYVYISDTTEDTTDAYIETALNRIRNYINNDSYTVSIRYDRENAIDLCGDENNGYCDESFVLNHVFNDDKTYMVRPYILTINNVDYDLAIVPVSDSYIKELEVNSKDYKYDISIETNSSDVPLDTSVGAKDVTDAHKNNGFVKAFDIKLYSDIKGEYISNIQDGVIVRIPVDDDYDKEYINIYYIKDDGQKGEKYEAKIEVIDGKKYAVFTTDHFSIYAIEGTKNVENKVKNPNTYDGIFNSVLMGIISLIGLVGTTIYLKNERA